MDEMKIKQFTPHRTVLSQQKATNILLETARRERWDFVFVAEAWGGMRGERTTQQGYRAFFKKGSKRISFVIYSPIAFLLLLLLLLLLCLCLRHLRVVFFLFSTARGLQYSGPVITLRVQHGQHIQFFFFYLLSYVL